MEFVRFVITGGIAACVNIGIRIPLGLLLPYSASIVVAYLIGMTTAFVLARLFVFEASSHSTTVQYARFTLVNAFALLQVWLVSIYLETVILPRWGMVWHPKTVAYAIGVISPVITSYYAHKFFSFRGRTFESDQPWG
jgi:putative flippase GtrA